MTLVSVILSTLFRDEITRKIHDTIIIYFASIYLTKYVLHTQVTIK